MQIGPISTGKLTDLLQLSEAGIGKTQIVQAHRQIERLEQGEQLPVCLGSKTVAAEAFFQTQLNQNSEANLLAVEHVVAVLQLGQTVVYSMGCHCAAAGSTQSANHSCREPAGIDHPPPGFSAG